LKTTIFDIKGMSCSACVAHVEKGVRKLDGLIAVQVNLLTNSMSVRYDEASLSAGEIETAVKNAGYEALLREKVQPATSDTPLMEEKMKTVHVDAEMMHMKKRWIISIVLLIPLLYISMGEMLYLPIPAFLKGHQNALAFSFIQFLIALPVYIVNNRYFVNGFRSLFRAAPNMDSLIAIGSSAAMVYGIYAIFSIGYGLGHGNMELVMQFSHDIYFESGATILTLITLGKYFEARSKSKTSEALTKLMNLAPKTATVLREDKELEVAVEQVLAGDMVVVRSGQLVPVDGLIVHGNATLDEATLTGESMPVFKQENDQVLAATVCKTGYFIFKATKVGEDTTLAQIIHLVEQASASKAPISKLADKISGVFVPVVIAIALVATVTWLLLGYPFDFALSIGIAVLVISCPCALGLATPVAIMVGTGRAAEQGMLIKSAETLETGYKIDTIVLDKTGTLTAGTPVVTKVIVNRFFTENKLIEIAASLEKPSEHPLAGAVLDEALFRGINELPVDDFEAFPGMGIKGAINQRVYMAGNLKMMEVNAVKMGSFEEKSALLADEGNTLLFIANSTEVLGVIAVADVLKSGSAAAVKRFQQLGMEVVMLTGDHLKSAQVIQHQLSIEKVIAEVLPHEKEMEIRKLQEQGKKVAMVGDGINDAPALMRADLGIAIGAGTDIAMESADVVLISNELSGVASFIQLSKDVMLNIKQNLFWAFFYNVLGIPIAAGAFYTMWGWKLSPMFAAAAMSLSSVTVVLNALRLRSGVKKVSKKSMK
jgi:P-type Cu+ transporter